MVVDRQKDRKQTDKVSYRGALLLKIPVVKSDYRAGLNPGW